MIFKLIGVALTVIGIAWVLFWYYASAMTTDSGSMNSLTWTAWGIAAIGLLPVGFGVWMVFQ